MVMAPHGKWLPADDLHGERSIQVFEDVKTREKWPIDPNIVHRFPNKMEALIQIAGNWKITKWRKTGELYECMQCHTQMTMTKHPNFMEV